ncbi:MAG: 30S ribosomal protein S17 [Dehalococcoidia bacterium]|nr:30S ribosomal protein S17 [Dehalococcoidia bacterium]MYK25644.1 30S ribosomal protein S17 [Dehalococcoidia bacterium]
MSARILQGVVVSDKMDKTVVVNVARRKQHALYRKVINRSKRFKAHDAENECNVGDTVRILETRPISKGKRWRVIEILERGDVAEVSPEDIGRSIEEEVQASPTAAAAAEAEAEAGETGDEEDGS